MGRDYKAEWRQKRIDLCACLGSRNGRKIGVFQM